jgi:hypothetical protein
MDFIFSFKLLIKCALIVINSDMALDIILGPMFSGKTTELINRISTSTYRKLIIKHQSDLLRYNTTGLT